MIFMGKKVIDLFCGAGGLSKGFEKSGFKVIAGFDTCKDSINTFVDNHDDAEGVITDLSQPIPNLGKYVGVDIVIGGPPCQGFSISGKRDPNDDRNSLYKAYLHTLETLKPKYFLMENVPNLVSMDKGRIKDQIIQDIQNLGYTISYQILNAKDFGVPQSRRRVFFIGSKNGNNITLNPIAKSYTPSRDAISDLPESSVNDGEPYDHPYNTEYQQRMRSGSKGIWNHQITNHSDQTRTIIALVPDGGNYKNLPEHLKDIRKVNIAWTRFNSERPSNTIDTGHRHHFHYKWNRVPTVRESARLQSFPDSFVFHGSKTSQYRQVGNAVPPLMAEIIAKQILEQADDL
jgi:DNA (cytosine-5)-methyltransferase 1